MSIKTLPALYRSETFGSRFGWKQQEKPAQVTPVSGARAGAPPQRQVPFLTQLIVGNDPDFHNKLGRADVARARELAYADIAAMTGRTMAPDGLPRRAIADRLA